MSVFTNPAGAAEDHAEQYIAAVLALVESDDPLEILRGTPAATADAVRGLSGEPEDSLALFGVLRSANLRLLDRASEADLDRVAVHAERGDESVRHMIRLYAGHDLVHRRQLVRIREGLGEAAGA